MFMWWVDRHLCFFSLFLIQDPLTILVAAVVLLQFPTILLVQNAAVFNTKRGKLCNECMT